jgi:hypothetical protein
LLVGINSAFAGSHSFCGNERGVNPYWTIDGATSTAANLPEDFARPLD